MTGLIYGGAIFDTLTAVDINGKVQPYLAQSVTPNADATVFTITLRPGIKFHDGSPLDGDAVAQSLIANVKSPQNGPALFNVSDIKPTGPLTATVTCKESWPAFPYYLAYQIGTVMAPSMLASPNGGNLKPIGTGPFAFKDKLFVSVSDANNTATEHEVHFLYVNMDKPPFDDLRVRQALAYATDQNRIPSIVDVVNPPIKSPFTPGSPYFVDVDYPTFNPAKAKQLIAAYEHDKGPMRTFNLATVTDAKDLERCTLIQAMWKESGINCQVQQIEQSQYIVQLLQGDFDVREGRQFSAADPDENYVWWSSLTASPIGQLALNFPRNKDPQIQASLEKGRTSLNQADRVAAYQNIARRLAADIPYIWLDETVWLVAAKPTVENFNNPTLPDGSPALRMTFGFINVGQIWLNQ